VEAMEQKPEMEVTFNQQFDEQKAAEDYAVYLVKADYYKESRQTSVVGDFYTINAISMDSRKFRDYVENKSKMEISSSEEVVKACMGIEKRRLNTRTHDLSKEWNELIKDYLEDKKVSEDRFILKTLPNSDGEFKYELSTNMGKIKKAQAKEK